MADAAAERVVADLIVVLDEVHESRQGHVGGRLAATFTVAVARCLPLERVTLGKRPAEMPERIFGVILVVAAEVSVRQNPQGMVDVVVPLRRVDVGCAFFAHQQLRLIGVVLQDQVDRAVGDALAHLGRDLPKNVRFAVIQNRVHRIQPQAVEVELFEPVECIVHEEVADHRSFGTVEVDPGAPMVCDAVR